MANLNAAIDFRAIEMNQLPPYEERANFLDDAREMTAAAIPSLDRNHPPIPNWSESSFNETNTPGGLSAKALVQSGCNLRGSDG